MAETRIHVDFNGFEEDGRLPVLMQYADGIVMPKWPVLLYDADGNRVMATIEDIRPSGVGFAVLDWSTWNRVKTIVYGGLPKKTRIVVTDKQTGMKPEDAKNASSFVLS